MPVNAHQCHLPMPPNHCSLSVSITAASLAHISEGEKPLIYKILYNKNKEKTFFSKFCCFWFV
ncbi:unnamed protein product [Staurois parvus]|uniref:Uncharacterized protein n=1 Tax=Staurois parvus TaxID=386267 RepID=A0ABN9HXI1_9NEOB|nr:unnamed protein product [Staurois parvus]